MRIFILALALLFSGVLSCPADVLPGADTAADRIYYESDTILATTNLLVDMTGGSKRSSLVRGITVFNDSATDTLLVTAGRDAHGFSTNFTQWLINGAPHHGQPFDTTGIASNLLIPPVPIPPGELAFFPVLARYLGLRNASGNPIPWRALGGF